ncbi:MAG: hypothetical protein LBM03_00990 [Erysipelotrichaceae bacterium]|jgi:hypothetical protein|nr:hypothetical protein [Erysipelotrichaceae bacterium]
MKKSLKGGNESMTKFKKLSGIILGAILAIGVGASLATAEVDSAKAATGDYNLVTDMSTLVGGDKILITAVANNMVMGSQVNSNYRSNVSLSISGDVIPGANVTGDMAIVTLGGQAGAWTLSTSEGYLILNVGGKNNYLRTSSTSTNTWTITGDGTAATISPSSYSDRAIKYNSGSPRFACYSSGQVSVQIYKQEAGAPVTGIRVANDPDKVSYYAGDLFDPTGMVINNVHSDGSEVATGLYTYAPTGELTAADTVITITSTENTLLTTTLIISVTERTLVSILVSGDMEKKTYSASEEWDYTGIVVSAHYNIGPDDDITEEATLVWNPNPAKPALGITSMTVAPAFEGVQAAATTISGIVVEDTIIYDFVTNFGTYSATGWANSYAEHIVTSAQLGSDLPAATITLPLAAKQTSTITDRPVIRGGSSNSTVGTVLEFELNDTSKLISSITVEFKDWNATTSAITLLDSDATALATNSASGTALGTRTVSASGLALSKFSVTTSRIGLTSIEITTIDNQAYAAAATWAEGFLNDLVCDNGATAPNLIVWGNYASSFAALEADVKTAIIESDANVSGDTVEQAVARYDYIMAKYGNTTYTDFLGRHVAATDATVNAEFSINDTNTIMLIVIVSVLSVSVLGGTFYLRKKEHN